MRARRRWWALALAAVATLGAAGVEAAPAGGVGAPGGAAAGTAARWRGPDASAPGEAERAGTEDPGALRVVSQTPWVGADEGWRLVLGVRSDAPADRLTLGVSVHRRVSSRSDFARTLAAPAGRLLAGFDLVAVSELPADAGGNRAVGLAVGERLAAPGDLGRVVPSREGVYPVTVTLRSRDDGAVLARLTTHLVYLPEPVTTKLGVALVLPAHAPPALRPDGSRSLAPADARALGGLGAALEAHPDVPVTLRPTPETMVALAGSAGRSEQEALARLARPGPARQVVGGPYVAAPLAALRASGLEADAERQLALGAEALAGALGARPGPATAVVDGRSGGDDLARLAANGARVVVAEELLAPAAEERLLTLAQPFALAPAGPAEARTEAAVGDAGLAAHLGATADPQLAAARFLADVAVLYLDAPGARRAVVALAPATPERELLDAVLGGLATSPVAAGTTVDGLFADVPPATTRRGRELVRELAPPGDDGGGDLPGPALRRARERLATVAGVFVGPSVPLVEELEEARLVAESSDLDGPARAAYLDGIGVRIDEALGRVRLQVDPAVILTARRGDVPVTVANDLDHPVRVAVRLGSEKLAFPDGDTRVVVVEGRATQRLPPFVVDARTSGRFALDVSLSSSDGAVRLGSTRSYVRSTAASGVGVALTAGALVVLAAWWGRSLLGEHRRKRRERERARDDGQAPVPGAHGAGVASAVGAGDPVESRR